VEIPAGAMATTQHRPTASFMKNKSARSLTLAKPSEDDIRNYAFHLYEQSNCVPGHDLDHWLEATACLQANIPSHQSAARLHHHFNRIEPGELSLLATEAKILAS
jgi:hypothetical protein